MRVVYKTPAEVMNTESVVQQEYKPFHVLLEDYVNGNVAIPQSEPGSFEFAQEGDVDFNKPMDSGHHDIYSVASGADPVFKDSVPVTEVSTPSPSVDETPASE